MERTFNTTDEMDKALDHHARLQGQTAQFVFDAVVTQSMDSLVVSFLDAYRSEFSASYIKLTKEDKLTIDSILAKATEVTP
jgi:hypothetical protein